MQKYIKVSTDKSFSKSKVIHYKNLSGLKQVMWNSIRSKDDLRFFVYEPTAEYLDYNFYDTVRQKYVERNIITYELLNTTTYPDFTKIKEFLKLSFSRYINPDLINIKNEILIYNDVTAIYRVAKKEVLCIEIYNEKLAQMQKQIFNFIWKRSQELEIYGEGGALRLKSKDNIKRKKYGN